MTAVDTQKRGPYNKKNKNLKKRCGCPRRTWERCKHPWFFNFKTERGSLGVTDRVEAEKKFALIKAAILNGTYVRSVRTTAEPVIQSGRPTFDQVAEAYANDPDGMANLSDSEKRQFGYDRAFLATVTVAPGLVFAEKPFAEFIRADIKVAVVAKASGQERTYTRGERTWKRKVGGKVAANRLHDRLRAMWNWAIEQGYSTNSPFDLRVKTSKNRLKHIEYKRNRRLAEGEEAALLANANPHLHDVIVAVLESAMRIGEVLSLQWKQVRFLQNDILLPGPKTKTDRDRTIPLTATLRELLTRRQHGMTRDPDRERRFKFSNEQYVFGDETGAQVKSIRTAWEATVLRAHNVQPERVRKGGALTAACRKRLAEIDLHVHDLRREAASRRYFDMAWTIYDVSKLLGHANVDTTERYLGVADTQKRLQELVARPALTLVR